VRPLTTEGLARPLIDLDRADIERYLRDNSIPWREDSTNANRDFDRNRIRHDLLPQLIRDWNPALIENLSHTAKWAQDEESYWDTEIDRLAATLLVLRPPAVLLRSADLCSVQPAVARRLVRKAIELAKGDLRGIDFHHVTRMLEMAAAPKGHDCTQAPGLNICRSFDWIRIAPPRIQADFRMPVSIPGRFALPGATVALDFTNDAAGLDGELMKDGLELRNWRPGDHYRPLGRATEEKIKVLFQEARIPLWERRTWPILAIGDDIVWARHFGPATQYAATSTSRAVVKIWEDPT
jgi:tRNA(Ile)-lysidine synthase